MIHDIPISFHPVSCSIRFVRYCDITLSLPLFFIILFIIVDVLFFILLFSFSRSFAIACEHILSHFRYFHSIVCVCVSVSVTLKFLENENHISIIQRLATETHSYSGRSRLTPVNPKMETSVLNSLVWEWVDVCVEKNMSNEHETANTDTRIWKTNTHTALCEWANGANAFRMQEHW